MNYTNPGAISHNEVRGTSLLPACKLSKRFPLQTALVTVAMNDSLWCITCCLCTGGANCKCRGAAVVHVLLRTYVLMCRAV
jgi:hypothetical protein